MENTHIYTIKTPCLVELYSNGNRRKIMNTYIIRKYQQPIYNVKLEIISTEET